MVLLWVLVVVLALVVLILIVLAILAVEEEESGSGVITEETSCDQLTEGLPEIGAQPCCEGGGGIKYNYELAMEMSSAPVSYQSICRQYCPPGLYDATQDVCLTTDPLITSQVEKCIKALKPVNCTGLAKPVAISYGSLYYGLRANLEGCSTGPCIL